MEVIVEPTTERVLVRGGCDWLPSSCGAAGGEGAEEPGTELGSDEAVAAGDGVVVTSGRETEVMIMCGMA